jgi:peptide chain release factor 1
MFIGRLLKRLNRTQRFFSNIPKADLAIPGTKLALFNQFKIPRNHIILLNYLASQPITHKFSSEFKVFDELYVQLIELKKQLQDTSLSPEDKEFFENELQETTQVINEEHDRILNEVVETIYVEETDKIDSAIMEFRGGVGGAESTLFAIEMADYYRHYMAAKGYHVVEENSSQSTSKVIRYKIKGEKVYAIMICESGIHKVIRVPETESKGRLHSSTISIVVLPDVPMEFKLNEKELRIDYMRAQGPGGQHVNKTESACRITHMPSGVSVLIQEDRSQAKNRARAMEIIREKLYQIEFEKREEEQKLKRKGQIGTGDRSDKIRTYNFPQDRITDHRLNKTVFGIVQQLSSGDLFDECISAIQDEQYQAKIDRFYTEMLDKYPDLN